MTLHILHQERLDPTLVQALAQLAQMRLHMALLEEEYQQQEQRLMGHLKRTGLLSDALASERAKRLALQARVAELERQRCYFQATLQTADQPPKEWAVGE